jgi:hypothetical protein
MTRLLDVPQHPCNDCGAEIGQPHDGGCDVRRCMWTGEQGIQCGLGLTADCCRVLREAGRDDLAEALAYHLGLDDPEHDCGEDVWTGIWPGTAECIEFGWFSYFGPPWTRCGPDNPAAGPDLTRLHFEARWDREAKRWVRP